MYVVCVTVHVIPEHTNDFIEAILKNAHCTRNEPGNVRFDVLRANDNENQFLLYEAYKTEDDFKAHQQTEHYLTWKDTVKDWMAEPRKGVKHTSLFPDDNQW